VDWGEAVLLKNIRARPRGALPRGPSHTGKWPGEGAGSGLGERLHPCGARPPARRARGGAWSVAPRVARFAVHTASSSHLLLSCCHIYRQLRYRAKESVIEAVLSQGVIVKRYMRRL
jgi:hypothetical protein